MLTPFQSVKLEDWANWILVNGISSPKPRGIREVDEWICEAARIDPGPFPRFDTDQPYTFGED